MATSVDVVLANYFAVTATMLLACMFLTGDTMLWCLLGILCFAAASLCAWVIVVLRRRIVPISKRRGSEDAHPEIMDADRRELSSIWCSTQLFGLQKGFRVAARWTLGDSHSDQGLQHGSH